MITPAAAETSTAFDQLDPRIQKWIWNEGWDGLRDIQEAAIPIILEGTSDVLIASPTASGKTEAAFLPMATAVASEVSERLCVVGISPLKALINDQHKRLESMFDLVDGGVHRWHGDVSQSAKVKFRKSPNGVLLITPESLEAMFVRRGHEMAGIVQHLRYVVVDEIHAFIGTERGRQVQSLLRRLEVAAERRIPRVALSATIGDLQTAAEYLRPGDATSVRVIESDQSKQEVKLQILGYLVRSSTPESEDDVSLESAPGSSEDTLDISDHLYRTLRGGRHLVFANARAVVELHSDVLRRRSEAAGVPNEFFPHHGSLDRGVRETAEARLRDSDRPTTLLATTTLELGIDVGSVQSVGQIGAPSSVAGLRQRLGRSGRRGDPAVVRIHVRELEVESTTPPQDRIRSHVVQSVAVVELLRRGWFEPPAVGALHLSTLVQQTLSLIAQYDGIRAGQAWSLLCGTGPFSNVDSTLFADFLRALANRQLLSQTHDGLLVLDVNGERLVNHYDFYAAFLAQEEFRIAYDGETLGSMPILYPLRARDFLIFAGRRWAVVNVDIKRKLIDVRPSKGGRVPPFGGEGLPVHGEIRREMKRIYCGNAVPPYLDKTAGAFLSEGRADFRAMRLGERSVIEIGEGCLIFPWAGTLASYSLALILNDLGLAAAVEGVCISVADADRVTVEAALRQLCEGDPPSAQTLAQTVENKLVEKHHPFLTKDLLTRDYASSRIDITGALAAARLVLSQLLAH